jgi:peptidoglycan LD-endopeptidase LytH
MRRLVLIAIATFAVVPLAPTVLVHADDPVQQAAKEIADARDQANKAADAYFNAQSKLDSLTVQAQGLQTEVDDLTSQVAGLQDRVQQIAVKRFTGQAATQSPLLNGFQSPEEQMQVAALSAVINDTTAEDFDNYDSLTRDLADKQHELVAKQHEAEQQKATAAALRDQAIAEVQHMKEVEGQRLQDDAVRRALATEEAARAAKAAADAAKPDASTTTTELAFDPSGDAYSTDTGVPQTTLPNLSVAGGQTGGGGNGGRPGGAGGNDYGGPLWHCPTDPAAVAYSDTWGAPRSGGRRHEGVDMIGPIGTPIYAVVDGMATPNTEVLGGLTIHFYGADGNRYYYGHLDHYGKLGAVKAGDIIAYMGQTGNARFSVPHLHFEIHPGGGVAVDPYPTVRAHC